MLLLFHCFFFFKQKTAYEMRISDWSSDVCSSDLIPFDEIGQNLNSTLKSADSLLKQLDGEVAPDARKMIEEARAAIDAANQNMLASGSPLQRKIGRASCRERVCQ